MPKKLQTLGLPNLILAVDHYHLLRSLAAFDLSDAFALFFVGAKLPSINASDQSNWPRWSSSARNALLLEFNPVLQLGKFIRKKDKKTQKASLTKEQVSQFFDVIKKEFPKYYAFFLCAFRTGMRLGELLKTLSLNRTSDVSLCITKRKPFDILTEQPKIEENRGNCPSFEPLLNAFLYIFLNNNTELQLAQELARKYG